MTRYAIIAAALLVGVFIGWLLSRPKKASDETIVVEKKQPYWYLPWLGGLAVLMIGLFFLADPMRAPIDTKYAPATLKDGAIKPGQFNPDLSEDEKDD